MSAGTAIYLFRHGETEWNTQGRRQGHLDSPLTERGRVQAVENAKRLQQHRPNCEQIAVFSSTLGRAKQTASIMIKELGLPADVVINEPRLMECSFGSWEGLTTTEIKERYPEEWHARSSDRWNVPAPAGESYSDVHARVSEWYAGVSLAETTIVVCHGLTSRVFRGIFLGLSEQDIFDLKEPQDGFFELSKGTADFVN
ncbi:histidine phosphatase family protein [Shimia sp.]|uniref:histidine phosphatase family protein n=1 Tax=Shimia sp. TaxID=1954381 RepID=UPI003297575B